MRFTLSNAITTARVGLAPVVAVLLFRPQTSLRVLAFALFLVAAVSDLWDGYLARSRGETTDFGRVADPIADKLLLVAVLVPLHLLTIRHPDLAGLPVVDAVPLWAVLVLVAREVLVTGVRIAAARKGVVMASAPVGKYKALSQNVFLGAGILWVAFRTGARELGWTGSGWTGWMAFHGWVATALLLLAVALTVYSLFVYSLRFRRMWPLGEVGGS